MKRIYFILLAIIAYACVEIPSDLSAPEWDVNLNIPITDRFYNIDSLLKDSEYGRPEQVGNYIIYSFYSDTMFYQTGISGLLEDKLDFQFSDYTFPLAEGEITIDIPLPDSVSIEKATFLSGLTNLIIHNLSNKDLKYDIQFLDFTKSSEKISTKNSLSPNNTDDFSFDLSNVEVDPKQNNSISISVKVEGQFDSTLDSAKITLKMQHTVLKYLRGKLPPTYVENISETVSIDFDEAIDDFRNKITLDGAELVLNANYHSQYQDIPEVQISSLELLGSYNQETLSFQENGNTILEDIIIDDVSYTKTFTSDNSNVNEFLAFLPKELSLSGNCLVNPQNKVFEASIYDSIEVSSYIRSPLRLSIDSLSIKDTIEHNIGDEKNNLEDALHAVIISRITNGLPLSVHANITIVDNNYKHVVSKNITLDKADIISDYEFAPKLTETEIELDSLDLINISKSFYVIYELKLLGDKSQFVTYKASDGIDIKSYLNVDYRIKED